MERSTRIALLVTGGLALGCAGLGVMLTAGGRYARDAVVDSFTQDPDEVAAIAEDIAGFDLPPGYTGVLGWQMMGASIATFSAGVEASPLPTLTVMRYPGERDPEQALQQLSATIGASGEGYVEVERRTLPIRGEPATVTRSQGTRDGRPVTREVTAFEAGGGTGLAMALGETEGWDQGLVDTFLLSIR